MDRIISDLVIILIKDCIFLILFIIMFMVDRCFVLIMVVGLGVVMVVALG